MAIGDITDSSGNVVRTSPVRRPSGGYYPSSPSPTPAPTPTPTSTYVPSAPGLKETTPSPSPSPAPQLTILPVTSPSPIPYVPKVGDITDSEGNLVRTEAIKRPGGGYYSVDSPETTALREEYGLETIGRPTTDSPTGYLETQPITLTPAEEEELLETVLPVDDKQIIEPLDDEDDNGTSLMIIVVVIVIAALIFAFGRR